MANLKRYWCGWPLEPFSDKPLKRQQEVFSSVLCVPLLFLLMGQGASEKETCSIVISGVLGGSVTFPLNISGDAEIENVAWNYPPKSLAIAFSPKHVHIVDKDYSGRLNISNTYSMHISNLTKNDSGSYQAQINQKNSGLTRVEKFILRIYGSSLAVRCSQAETPAEISETPAGHMRFSVLSQRYEKLDMPAETTRPKPTTDTSSDSNATIEDDEEGEGKTRMHSSVDGRSEVYDMDTQGHTARDLASERQTEHEMVTPDDTVVKSEVEEDITYLQVYLNVQGKIPVPQKKENSNTIYCSVQKPNKMVPTLQQDAEPPEHSLYENFT